MYNENSYLGTLGDYTPITAPVFTPAVANIQAVAPAASSSPSFWSNVMNIGNKVISTVNTVLPAAQNLKSQIDALKAQSQQITSGGASSSGSAPNQSGGGAPASPGISTGAKVAIGLGIATVLGGGGFIIYKASKKK